jgi:hypothetical protein
MNQVLGGHLAQQLHVTCFAAIAGGLAKAHRPSPQTLADNVLDADKGPAADEQDIAGVDLDVLLFRMLTATLGRDVGNRSLEHLEQGLLDAFARNVPRDGHIVASFANFVDFVDIQDAPLGGLQIEIGRMQQFQQ